MRTTTIASLAVTALACSGPVESACEGEYLVFDYVFDGEAGTTGCVSAAGITGRTVVGDYLVTHLTYGHDVIGAENRRELSGLPSEALCTASLELRSTPLVTGASGACENLVEYAVTARPEVGAILVYDRTPGPDGPCYHDGATLHRAVLTGGTWHVIEGGQPGDWVEVEAHDVTFEPIQGHTFRFDRMRWRVQLPFSGP